MQLILVATIKSISFFFSSGDIDTNPLGHNIALLSKVITQNS
jgi:hypothetical protein